MKKLITLFILFASSSLYSGICEHKLKKKFKIGSTKFIKYARSYWTESFDECLRSFTITGVTEESISVMKVDEDIISRLNSTLKHGGETSLDQFEIEYEYKASKQERFSFNGVLLITR